jgi:hypothetical protein
MKAANVVIPFIAHFIESSTNAPFQEPTSVEACSTCESAKVAAGQLMVLFDKYRSDKSTFHSYHCLYGSILANPAEIKSLIESGLGTTDPAIVSNAGPRGKPGASLRAFRDFLPNAGIYGADLDEKVLFEDERIQYFLRCPNITRTLNALSEPNVDLVIDDGLHSPNANIATLIFAYKKLKRGGSGSAAHLARYLSTDTK